MNLPEYNTTNCEEWEEWANEDQEDDRFKCLVPSCREDHPNNATYYFVKIGFGIWEARPICNRHKKIHRAIEILKKFDDEVLSSDFNPISIILKLHEEGII